MEALPQTDQARGRWFTRTLLTIALLSSALLYALASLPATASPAAGARAGDSLYVVSLRTAQILRYDGATGAFRNVAAADFGRTPFPDSWEVPGMVGMAVGPDANLYVADLYQQRVLRFDGATGARIDTFVDLKDQGIYPGALAFGPDHHLYVVGNREVLRYDGKTGALLGVAAVDPNPYPGPGIPSQFSPVGIAFGPDGKLYTSTASTSEIWRFDPSTGAFSDIFVTPFSGGLSFPTHLVFGPDRNLYVISFGTNQVLRYDGRTGAFMGVAADAVGSYPSPDDPRGTAGRPGGLAFGPDGNLYVSNAYNNEVRRYDGRTGAFMSSFIKDGQLKGPITLAFGPTQASVRDDAKPALVTVVQRPQLELSADGGEIVNTIVAVNRGKGPAVNTFLTLPFDPAKLAVLDVRFSRPGAWVSALRPEAIEIETGRLGSQGDVVTATVRLKLLPGVAAESALTQRLSYRWKDDRSGGGGRSNLPVLVAAQQHASLLVEPASGPAGAARVVRSASFAPDEPISLWYNTPAGSAVAVGQVKADSDGAIRVEFSTAGLPAGAYSIVAYGAWTELTAVGSFEVD